MRSRTTRVGAAAVALAGMMAAYAGSAGAEPGPTPWTYKQVPFQAQDADVDKLVAATQMTKDLEGPARAFSGPTSMAAKPDNPRIVVAATADHRSRTCYLTISRDAGRTWHFSEELPTDPAYPWCTNTSAGTPHANVAWGRDGTLYYAHMAYGDGEGPREGHSSAILARTTNLGETWETALVRNNRGKTGPAAGSVTSVPGLAVDTTTGDQDVVYVGFSESYPDAPTGDPLRDPHVMIATSTDGGRTFGESVDVNKSQRPSITINGTPYELLMRTGFGAPFIFARDGVLLVVAGPDFADDEPAPPPEAGANLNPGSWYAYPMPQLIARSTDGGKTFDGIKPLGDPILAGTGSYTGLGWTPKGGPNGTIVAAYAATPATSPTIALADIVVQRSTDGGITWTSPLAIDDDRPEERFTGFYPQLNVAPNGRVDVAWQDDRGVTDFHFNVRYTYSTDGGQTWAPNIKVNDIPINFNYGVSFNSDIRQPNGVASTNSYAIIGWADTRHANETSQTQDNYATAVQFAPLPTTRNTTAPVIAAIFGGLVVAGIVLLVALQFRKRNGEVTPAPSAATARVKT